MKKAFTLIELLVVMAILAIMVMIMVGILNPAAQVNKGYDARKKKDINRIKISFEEYYNDKGCFPVVNENDDPLGLLLDTNCSTGVFAPWLSSWPCTPQGKHYLIATEMSTCPKWFKIATKLDNLSDTDIPKSIPDSMGGEITKATANYGASSLNITWNEGVIDPDCEPLKSDPYEDVSCFAYDGSGSCNQANDWGPGHNQMGCKSPINCFSVKLGKGCKVSCRVDACGQGRF